jgi:hypothetical protein
MSHRPLIDMINSTEKFRIAMDELVAALNDLYDFDAQNMDDEFSGAARIQERQTLEVDR